MRKRRHTQRSSARLGGLVLLCGCGFQELVPADSPPASFDDLPDSVTIDGIQVAPAVIHPGDRVTLRDPQLPGPTDLVPLYYWDACEGAPEQDVVYSREAHWTAPSEPGVYALTVNITNTARARPSRALHLCVVAPGEEAGSAGAVTELAMAALTATPSSFVQSQDCGGRCTTNLAAEVTGAGDLARTYRWRAAHGDLRVLDATARWTLPELDCCPETFTVAVTVCEAVSAAATGFIDVTARP